MHIGDVELENRLILAPLASMLTLSLRQTYRKFGAAMTCVGIIDAKALAESNEDRLINLIGHEEITSYEERPVSVQLIGSEIKTAVKAAKRIEKLTSVIDLNFSGPIRLVMDQGIGAASLRDPGHIKEMVAAVSENVNVPVTAKIRVGIQDLDVDVLKIARNCEMAGASAIVVHARSANEGYAGPAHWDFIREVKENVGIPVIGNGNVNSPMDAKKMFEITGCDFVMIGTSAVINPMIFSETNNFLRSGGYKESNRSISLFRFLKQYALFEKKNNSKNMLSFVRTSCRKFFGIRSYMKKLKTGTILMK